MRTTILFISAATAIAAIAVSPASAQERSFAGPRIEALTGYDRIDTEAPAPGADDSIDGGHVRVQAGYDLALGDMWRVGAEAGIGWQLGAGTDYAVGSTNANVKSRRDIDLSLRVGATVSEKTFLYVKAGWANTAFRGRVTDAGTALTVTDDEDGVRGGLGIEHMLGERLYTKAEYRYTDYGHDLSRHQALVGVGYRF